MKLHKFKKITLVIVLSISTSTAFASKLTESLQQRLVDKQLGINQLQLNSKLNGIKNSILDTLLIEISTKDLLDIDKELFEIPGVEIKTFSTKYNRVSLEVSDYSQIPNIDNIDKVVMMFPNYGSVSHVGSVTSRALATMKPPTNLTVTGKGQKIGIISNSFARTPGMTGLASIKTSGNSTPISLKNTNAQKSGDLPITVDLRNDNKSSARQPVTDEGAGMAELAYDIAPGSAIAFHTAGENETGFANAITDLCTSAKSTVVVDDVLFLAEPVYQVGNVAQAAIDCVNSGVAYFSSIGNSANSALRQQFKDANPNINDNAATPTGNDFHQWSNGSRFLKLTLNAGKSTQIFMQWNQPSTKINASKGAEIDLDMYLYSAANVNSTILSSSTDMQAQSGGLAAPFGDALEAIILNNTTTTNKTYYLAIDNFFGSLTNIPQDAGTPLEFSIVFFGRVTVETIRNTTSQYGGPSTYGHSTAQGVISVAASPWYKPTSAEDFSSRGGNLTVFFDNAGNFNPVTKFVPDITAVDGNNTSFFGTDLFAAGVPSEPDGFPNFHGTSASAPNAAAVAMLGLEVDPTLTPAKLISLLQSTATDITGGRTKVGNDDVTGAGLINIGAFLTAVKNNIDTLVGSKPVITAVTEKTSEEGQEVKFSISASDVDGDVPVLSISNNPAGVSFADNLDGTGSFTWLTTAANVGVHNIKFTATDGNLATPGADSTIVKITVTVKTNPGTGAGGTPAAGNDGSGSGGCTLNKSAKFDPLLPSLMFLFSILFLSRKLKK